MGKNMLYANWYCLREVAVVINDDACAGDKRDNKRELIQLNLMLCRE